MAGDWTPIRRRNPDEWDLEFLPWMEGLHHTLGVYDWGVTRIREEEHLITQVLDDLVEKQLNDPKQIEAFVARAKASASKLVSGRTQRKGEELLNTWSGTQHDRMIKHMLQEELRSGRLKTVKNFKPNFSEGPDFTMPNIAAWDLTTMAEIGKHIKRDSQQREWQRYYILVWDEIQISASKLRRHQTSGE